MRMGIANHIQIDNTMSLCPGSADTPMRAEITEHMRKLTGETAEKFIEERIASKNLQKRLLESVEIACMAVNLASDDARGIIGQIINVDGGTVLF